MNCKVWRRPCGAWRDASQQLVERANLELSRRETIMACMAEGVLAVDKNLRVNFCNTAFAEAFSTRVPESEGRTLYEVVREPVLRDILERVAKTGVPEKDLFRLPSAAGRWFEARSLPLGEEARRGAMIALHDVTDIERQEEIRKQFVADVSHELRTPLTAIRGYAETLLDGGLEDEANNRKFVEIILHNAIRLNNIAVRSAGHIRTRFQCPARRSAGTHCAARSGRKRVQHAWNATAAGKSVASIREQCRSNAGSWAIAFVWNRSW